MILSTLSSLPGRTFEVRSLVLAEGYVGLGGTSVAASMNQIAQQATQVGANAVVDVTVTRIGDGRWVVTGNAVVVS